MARWALSWEGVLSAVRCLALAPAFATPLQAQTLPPAYTVEDIAPPPGVVPECGGLSFLPDGRLAAVFHHGEVYLYTPSAREWKLFATGLHDPMGVLAISDKEILVTQRPELTRLVDTDGDGTADLYECITDAWGLSGNYHEFACGIARDAEGNLYVSVTNGSNAGVARYEVRGTFKPEGYTHKSHFSAVPYRGWIAKVTPSGQFIPLASGFRQPNGLTVDLQGRLFASDNQGDWVGTSKLFHVQEGRFYGHVPSLVWREDYQPGRSVDEHDRLRTEGAVLLPHAILANSPGQPIFDTTAGKFGPFTGQMLLTEFNIPRLLRVMLEEVHGELQGAATTFFEGPPLRPGNHRLAFAPDGSLWVGQSERKLGWPGAAGLQRLVWTGQTELEVTDMNLTQTGFALTFTKPLDLALLSHAAGLKGRRYYYQYHQEYGSPQTDVHPVQASAIQLSNGDKTLTFAVDTLLPGYVYEWTLGGIRSAKGETLAHPLICYTATRLLDGSTAPIPRPAPTGAQAGSGKDQPKLGVPVGTD